LVIDLAKVLNPRHKEFFQATDREVIFYGGAHGGKSYSASDKIIVKMLYESKALRRRLEGYIVRRSMPSLKRTSLKILTKRLDEMHIPRELNRQDMVMRFPDFRESEVTFLSVYDQSEIDKLQSITDVDFILIEEAPEILEAAYEELRRRLRGGKSSSPQLISVFNPKSMMSWMYRRHWELPSAARKIRATVDDNPFARPEEIAELDALKLVNENQYRVYRLGEWGQLEGAIYNWPVVPELPTSHVVDAIIGQDFGYPGISATVRVHILVNHPKFDVILEELIYEPGLTNQDLITHLRNEGVKKGELIYGDTADQNRIEEIRRAGFSILDADKMVHDGIVYMQGLRVGILDGSPNIEKEAIAYSWVKDRHGHTLEAPVKFMDHAMDAARYACFSHRYQIRRFQQQVKEQPKKSGPELVNLSAGKNFSNTRSDNVDEFMAL
jgi:phage terminase large subunit